MKMAKLLKIPLSIFQNMHRMIRSMSTGIMRHSKKKRRSGWSRMTIRIKMTGLFLMWCRYTRNEDFIGVLGMDIDMALLKEKVDSVQIYESG